MNDERRRLTIATLKKTIINYADPASPDWADNMRINSSSANVAINRHFVINKIPLKQGQVFRIKGVEYPGGGDNTVVYNNGNDARIHLNSIYSVVNNGYASFNDETKTITWTAYIGFDGLQQVVAKDAVQFQASFIYANGYSANDIIITVDEVIE